MQLGAGRAAFAAAMSRLGPFGPSPGLALAVSGGADSTALALLAQDWAAACGGRILALIVDHGLRAESAAEACFTQVRLNERRIPAHIITLALPPGPALQERARQARHAALAEAARQAGFLHLAFGHQADDVAETVAMRAARGTSGLEGIAAWSARDNVLLLRPLLAFSHASLTAFLRTENMLWVEDKSNLDARFERVRIRLAGGGVPPAPPGPRRAAEILAAAFLARHCSIRPEGFAVIAPDSASPAALAALLRMTGGGAFAPAQAAVAALAANLRPATIGGVRITQAGRLGPGWLLAREPAACAPDIPASEAAVWDGRFRLQIPPPPGATLGALGLDAKNFRNRSDLPALVLRSMPCLRLRDGRQVFPAPAIFAPPAPAAAAPFFA